MSVWKRIKIIPFVPEEESDNPPTAGRSIVVFGQNVRVKPISCNVYYNQIPTSQQRELYLATNK